MIKIKKKDEVYSSYLKCVFEDKDFLARLVDIEFLIDSFNNNPVGLLYPGVIDPIPYNKFEDEVDYTYLSDIKEKIVSLAKEYQVYPEIIDDYLYNGDHQIDPVVGFDYIYSESDGKPKLRLEVDAFISKKDFEKVWKMIQNNRPCKPKQTRHNPTYTNPKTLYKIHRARNNNETFSTIAKTIGLADNEEDIKKKYNRFLRHLPKRDTY